MKTLAVPTLSEGKSMTYLKLSKSALDLEIKGWGIDLKITS